MKLFDMMWRRHSNTWSVWSRLLSTPLAFVPFWNRSWRQGAAVAARFAINPFLFPEPKDTEAWGPRAIRGERRWVEERPFDASLIVQSAGAALFAGGFVAAYRRRLGWTTVCAAGVIATNAWFLNRMAMTYGATSAAPPDK
jgi:hypothetical protein